MIQAAFWLTLGAAAATGLLAGASLDQSIKQLPPRRRVGVVAYSEYSQAGDLGNGIVFYAALGVPGQPEAALGEYRAGAPALGGSTGSREGRLQGLSCMRRKAPV
jgi:hypothetical protein